MTSKIGDTQDLKNIEDEWSEEDPRILETARKFIEEEKLTFEEREKIRKYYFQSGKQEEYSYQIRQTNHLYKNLPELIKAYPGLYVWFEDGEVKDFDIDEVTLAGRVVRNDQVKERKTKAVCITQIPEITTE